MGRDGAWCGWIQKPDMEGKGKQKTNRLPKEATTSYRQSAKVTAGYRTPSQSPHYAETLHSTTG